MADGKAPSAARRRSVRGSSLIESGTWRELLTRLGDRYGGMAGLVVHDFLGVRGTVLDFGDQWDPSIVALYERHAANNPWLAVMWRDPPGRVIVGADVHDLDRAKTPLLLPFEENFLAALDLWRGLGAVLWDDTFPAPRWCVVVAVLRPGAVGAYSAAEIAAFEDLIPFMSLAIRRHACVDALTAGQLNDLAHLNYSHNTQKISFDADRSRTLLADIVDQFATGDGRQIGEAAKAIGRLDDVGVSKLLVALGHTVGDLARASSSDAAPRRPAKPPPAGTRPARTRPSPPAADIPPPPPVPATWREAKAGSPGLISYAQAKAADPATTIIDHLRDAERGYGAWTLRPPGLPRSTLSKIDRSAYKALYNWLARTGGEEGDRKTLPADLHMPTRSQLAAVDVTLDDVRAAQRLAAQWRRQQARSRGRD